MHFDIKEEGTYMRAQASALCQSSLALEESGKVCDKVQHPTSVLAFRLS